VKLTRSRIEQIIKEEVLNFGEAEEYEEAEEPEREPQTHQRTPRETLHLIATKATLLHNMIGEDTELDERIRKYITRTAYHLYQVERTLEKQKFEGETLFRESMKLERVNEEESPFADAAARALDIELKKPEFKEHAAEIIMRIRAQGHRTDPSEEAWDVSPKRKTAADEVDKDKMAQELGDFLQSDAGKWAVSLIIS